MACFSIEVDQSLRVRGTPVGSDVLASCLASPPMPAERPRSTSSKAPNRGRLSGENLIPKPACDNTQRPYAMSLRAA